MDQCKPLPAMMNTRYWSRSWLNGIASLPSLQGLLDIARHVMPKSKRSWFRVLGFRV